MASGTNRKILAEATLKGGDVFKNYAGKVKNANKEAMAIKEFPLKKKK